MGCPKCGGNGRLDLYVEGLWRCAMCSTPKKDQPVSNCPMCYESSQENIRLTKELNKATDFIAKITAMVICANENGGCSHLTENKVVGIPGNHDATTGPCMCGAWH